MMTTDLGLYVHIPFCKKRCNYCDFCSSVPSCESDIDRYIDVLCEEIKEYEGKQKIKCDTLYLGGGTPSLLSPYNFERIISSISSVFDISSLAEFTMEVNPGTLTEEKLKEYKSFGLNRLSIGLQSTNERELSYLGRIHTYSDFLSSYKIARKCGIDNINVDLMFGIPHQTIESYKNSLFDVAELNPEHISAYGLIVEPGTRFYDYKEILPLPNEDDEADMYYLTSLFLKKCGYNHYEISNYAQAGYECLHNLKYWQNHEYIGLGVSAYSYYQKRRFGNSRSFEEYYSSDRAEYRVEDINSRKDEMFEYAMMRLRLSSGICLEEYKKKFSCSFLEGREEKIKEFMNNELLLIDNGRLYLTEQGFYLSNMVLSELL